MLARPPTLDWRFAASPTRRTRVTLNRPMAPPDSAYSPGQAIPALWSFPQAQCSENTLARCAVRILPVAAAAGVSWLRSTQQVRTSFNRDRLVQMGFLTESKGKDPHTTFASSTRTDMQDDNYAISLGLTHEDEWLLMETSLHPDDKMLHIDARIHRNEMAFINDPRPTRTANAEFTEVKIKGWPHVFVVATADMYGDDEVLVEYGEEFWERNAEQEAYLVLRAKADGAIYEPR